MGDITKGYTTLHMAVFLGYDIQTVQQIIESGCNLNHKDDKQGRTALHVAAEGLHTNPKLIEMLIRNGCHPNEKDKEGRTALHVAAEGLHTNPKLIEMLIQNGCHPNEKDKEGRTALHVAANPKHVKPDIIDLFLRHGSNQDDKDNMGNTPFRTLVMYRNEEDGNSRQNRIASIKVMKEYRIFMELGLPYEVREMDKKAVNVFASLLEEEGYHHYEARVMLAGEQGTGKTTIARFLIGKGPTKIRISTDGIELYNGLSFIDRETETWMHGKQDFTLSDIAISKMLRTCVPQQQNLEEKNTKSYELDGTHIQTSNENDEIHQSDTLSDVAMTKMLITDEFKSANLNDKADTTNEIKISKLFSCHEFTSDPNEISNHLKNIDQASTMRTQIEDEQEEYRASSELLSVVSEDSIEPRKSLANTPLNFECDTTPYRLDGNFIQTSNENDEIHQSDTSSNIATTKTLITDEVKSTNSNEKDQTTDQNKISKRFPNHEFTSEPNEISSYLKNIDQASNGRGKNEDEQETDRASTELLSVVSEDSIEPRKSLANTPLNFRCDTTPYEFDGNLIQTSNENDEIHQSVELQSKESIFTTEVVRHASKIQKLKKLFGIKKDVKEIKVSMTKKTIWKESLKAGKKKLHHKKIAPVIIWDFGGQDIFYSTHQTFLTYRAIYLIVLDGSRNIDDPCPFEQYLPGKSGHKTARDYLQFWINTIVTYCKASEPGFPKIMIVLTHKDRLKAEEVEPRRKKIFREIHDMFSGSPLLSHLIIEDKLFVNARDKSDPEMVKIKTVITEQAIMQPTWGQELPKCFIPLELEFDSLLSINIPLITMDHLEKINSAHPVRPLTEEELKVFLRFQHSVGRILYFDETNLDQHIIIAPTHLIDAFKSIVTAKRFCKGDKLREESWDLMSRRGVIAKKAVEDIWKKKKHRKFQQHKEYLLGVMTHLDILVEPKRYDKSHKRIPAEFFYVASMVKTIDTTGYLKALNFDQRNIAIAFIPTSSMIPPALSFRFISYCLSILAVKTYGQNNDEMLFHRSAVFNIDPSLDMCVNCNDESIVVRLVHAENRTLIMRDLASSIRECLAVALEKISQLYVKTSSTCSDTNKSSFDLRVCCSSSDDPCLISMINLQEHKDPWICPKHKMLHTKDVLSAWATHKDEIECGKACPVMDEEFLKQIPTDIHLRRMSMEYSINETKELAVHLGMPFSIWSDLFDSLGDEPARLKFEILITCLDKFRITFNDIKLAADAGKIQNPHILCKVVRGNPVNFNDEPEKWDLIPSEEHLDRLAPFIGNSSLAFLVELGMDFKTWEKIKYRQTNKDLVKLNRDILQEWKSAFCTKYSIRPSLRHITQAFNDIGKNVKIIENVLANCF